MKYSLHPEAEEDLRAAARYYRECAGVGVAQALLAEFERSIALILRHPRIGAHWLDARRRFHLRHFPFSIVYSLKQDEIRILAIMHQSRRPGYWRERQ